MDETTWGAGESCQSGHGSSSHLCAALFAQSVGVHVEIIPYRGAAPSLTDVIAIVVTDQ
jgi:tripartite-type tricarboxylate transporter receptor subunit TctC